MSSREVFVISDLHLGGAYVPGSDDPSRPQPRGFRINSRTDRLADFISSLGCRRARDPTKNVELVINGDFIDFLAEIDPTDSKHHAFIPDEKRAQAVLKEVLARDVKVFDALRGLLATGVDLTVLLGNHDIELSLPLLRAALEDVVLPRTGVARVGRLRFIVDGEAYVVGDVLIEHGNRYDGWNVVDHDKLRRLRSEMSRRLTPSGDTRFTPPPGSVMVERVMNPIKHDYPFIDLLKPETEAALPLLLALEPGLVGAAQAAVAAQLRWQAGRHAPRAPARPARPGDIAAVADVSALPTPSASPERALQQLLREQLPAAEAEALLALTRPARAASAADRGLIASGLGEVLDRTLSFLRLRGGKDEEQRLQVLLAALRRLRNDRSFDRGFESDIPTLEAAEELAQGGFAVIVFGHTHLAKQLPLKQSRATYINTGTWADLVRVPDEIVSGSPRAAMDSLRDFACALRSQDLGRYVKHLPTYARIELDAAGLTQSAQLCDYTTGCLETS